MERLKRGQKVIVRTAGGFPRVRRLWKLVDKAAIVAEEAAYKKLKAGLSPLDSGAVVVPVEDVFTIDPTQALNPDMVFKGWTQLRRI